MKSTNSVVDASVTPASNYLTPRPMQIFDLRFSPPVHKKIAQVSCGTAHSLALTTDGGVYSWGSGQSGRLGHGDVQDRDAPTLIQILVHAHEHAIVQVSSGDSHCLALSRSGLVYSWGSGGYGRLGLGSELDRYSPSLVSSLQQHATSISCHTFHSLAVVSTSATSSPSLYVWGGGKFGKLGLGRDHGERNSLIPAPVTFPGKRVIKAVCGLQHTIAITEDDLVYSWGFAGSFRCGFQSSDQAIYTPQRVTFFDLRRIYQRETTRTVENSAELDTLRVNQIASGMSHSLALCNEGTRLFGWGWNQHGQIGRGNQAISSRPVEVTFSADSISGTISAPVVVKSIACGAEFSLCITTNGHVYSWGKNNFGQLGLGHENDVRHPSLVPALQGIEVISVHAGGCHAGIVMTEKTGGCSAWVWGCNLDGQLGIGSKSQKEPYPVPITLAGDVCTVDIHQLQLSLGVTHSMILALKLADPDTASEIAESRVFTCGRGPNGELGPGIDPLGNMYAPYLLTNWEIRAGSSVWIDPRSGRTLPKIVRITAGFTSSFAVPQH